MLTSDGDLTPLGESSSKPSKSNKVTPRIARSSADERFLTETRSKIIEEMVTEMLECTFDGFKESYLPFVPSQHVVDQCMKNLKPSGLVTDNDELDEGEYSPELSTQLEPGAFRFINDIAEVLSSYRFSDENHKEGQLKKPRLRYEECPNNPMKSEISGADFRIDGSFRLQRNSGLSTREEKINAPDTAVVFEFKRSSTWKNTLDNRTKIVSAASHIMNDDPRRAYMFGITMEGTRMSLWYFSRSHSTKSEEFDYFKEPKKLITVFLSFLFGNPTRLGYDPAVLRCDTGTGIYYEYKVECDGTARYYRTLGTLSAYRSLGITGRMTRVWRAREISGFRGEWVSSKDVALKDVWLDFGARTEGCIQKAIFKALIEDPKRNERLGYLPQDVRMTLEEVLDKKTYHRYFMTIECDCDLQTGFVTKSKPASAVPISDLFTFEKADYAKSAGSQMRGSGNRSHPHPSRVASTSSSGMSGDMSRNTEDRMYVPKRRYLVVYSDVGKALHDASDIRTVFKALEDAFYALALMFVANWVHRDVSTGNIIILEEGGNARGKLSDLEYAKEFDPEKGAPDPKTGTAFFMAHEILASCYLYTKNLSDYAIPTRVRTQDGKTRLFDKAMAKRNVSSPKQVTYNIQHDLESMWWITLWFILACFGHKPSQEYAKCIFLNTIQLGQERGLAFKIEGHLVANLSTRLPETLIPFIDHLESTRFNLFKAYQSREDVCDLASYTPAFDATLSFIVGCSGVCEEDPNFPRLIMASNANAVSQPSSVSSAPNKDQGKKRDHPDAEYGGGVKGSKRFRPDALNPRRLLRSHQPPS